MLNRRHFLKAGLATGSAAIGGGSFGLLASKANATPDLVLKPRIIEQNILRHHPTKNVFSYNASGPAPILRAKQGQPFHVRLENKLPEPTTIHWHGLRLPNAMDGVPFVTQPYVYENETFDYIFTPPDAGTYWYHPHCNTLEQMSYGLTGVLVVDEKETPDFDADVTLNLRDWRLGSDGQFINLYKARKSARAGTFGTVKTTNWEENPVYNVPSGGIIRLRTVVSDVTRIFKLKTEGADATVIALDGYPVPKHFPLDHQAVGPGQRIDVAIRMPDEEGKEVKLVNASSSKAWTVATLRSQGSSLKRDIRDLKPLPRNPVPIPDLKNAEHIPFEFTATAESAPKNGFCGTIGFSFWAINRKAWLGVSPDPMEPLAELKLGKSYIFSFRNRTPHTHPIHLHGLSFTLLNSNKRQIDPFVTDTALVLPDERMDVAFVADNLGDWLLHCHIIEHQKTGMSSFIRIT
ncbi:multicopper oxidase family protein [uncultured Kiloniella sp.]|uniref:multicopper oxidase family protein n=1 Tax=uncultured Kiloniella sp. TaxID=1133091 RepID=UPI00260F28A9|nr:multicopper oxidase family protein [uncultured Kiloniella sp.]